MHRGCLGVETHGRGPGRRWWPAVCSCLERAPQRPRLRSLRPAIFYASPTGNDANPGTQAQPKRSPIALLAALAPGQTGCLQDGATFALGGGAAITATAGTPGRAQGPTAHEAPGQRSTISTATGFWIQLAAHDLTFKDLDIRRTGGGGGSLFMVDGDRIVLDGLDLTYPSNICLDVGDDPRAGAVDSTDEFVLRRSRIHDCGSAYGPPHFPNDSGVHGIYMQFLRDTEQRRGRVRRDRRGQPDLPQPQPRDPALPGHRQRADPIRRPRSERSEPESWLRVGSEHCLAEQPRREQRPHGFGHVRAPTGRVRGRHLRGARATSRRPAREFPTSPTW